MRSLSLSSQFLLLSFLSSGGLCQSFCPAGLQPSCPASSTLSCSDGSSPQCSSQIPSTSDKVCPKACNPHFNTCDASTAPTCIFPDPSVASPRAACACRPGYKATGYANTDASKHWRLPVQGQDYRVWVAEGVKCDTLCDISYGVDSCKEVTLLSSQCIGGSGNVIPGDTSVDTVSISVTEIKSSDTLTYYQVSDSSILGPLTITIPVLLPTNDTLLAHKDTDEYLNDVADSIAYSYPIVLEQLGVPYSIISNDLNETVQALTNTGVAMFYQPSGNSSLIFKRKLKWPKVSMKKVKDGISHVAKEATRQIQAASTNVVKAISKAVPGDVLCAQVAVAGIQGYLAEAALVYLRSPGPGVPIFKDQKFFLYPMYGDYIFTKDFRVHYDAPKESIEIYGAITFNYDMFFTAKPALFGPSWKNSTRAHFVDVTQTLIHEMLHTRQYHAHGWSKTSFGITYLHQYCKAGFSYSSIQYEKQAYATQYLMDDLLDDDFGYAFFEFWNIMQLESILGYPLDRAPKLSSEYFGQYQLSEVRFQHGVLQGSFGSANSTGDRCFRILNGDVLAVRDILQKACENPRSDSPGCEDFRRRWSEYVSVAAHAPICLDQLRR